MNAGALEGVFKQLRLDVKKPCPCGNGQPAERCHLDWDGQLRKPVPTLTPPGAITNFAHPRCYLQGMRNCSQDISREHYVSKAVLDQIGDTLRVGGMRWLDKDEILETSAASLTAKILCSRHNAALSPLDAEAALFFRQLREVHTDLDRQTLARKPKFHLASGEMLELWMLKVACGMFHSVGSDLGGKPIAEICKIDLEKVNAALFRRRWDDRGGLYFLGGVGQGYKSSLDVELAPLSDPSTGTYCGVVMAMQGMRLQLLFDSSTTPPWPWPGFTRRPSGLIFERRRREHALVLSWPVGTPDIAVRLTMDKSAPR
ncbi:hypothetical protein [Bradyrhizobium iriomotense]|uniref:hypothetical protein n=1 Tax=Bradyrhizobium iriomotense TaxID=441950 RepID=UPI001B8A08F6|nr:hypothetical protein [Bradyrhizobium iriomotense]MBR1132542.1 hypothetical protein [Bradyrhizobium iriomotense]